MSPAAAGARRLRAAIVAWALLAVAASPAAVASDVPYVPTPPEVVDAMLRMAGVRAGDRLLDLGSGDGRVVIAAVSRQGASGVGIELDPELVERARDEAARLNLGERARFLQGDIFRSDFGNPTVLTLYLLPGANLRLRPRILAMAPGTRVVSHDFTMGDWAPDQSRRLAVPGKAYGPPHSDLHLWIVPARVEGTWRWVAETPHGPRPVLLTLRQRYQRLTGTLRIGDREALLVNARLRGERLAFAMVDDDLPRHEYAGRVAGEALEGTLRVTGDDSEHGWKARRVPPPG